MDAADLAGAASRVPLARADVQGFLQGIETNELAPAREAAFQAGNERAVTVLLLAEAAQGRLPGTDILRRMLPLVEDVRVAVRLIAACPDDPVAMACDLVASPELTDDRRSAVLWATVQRLDGRPATSELRIQLRRHARRPLRLESAAFLALAAQAAGDPDVVEVAKIWIDLTKGLNAEGLAQELRVLWHKPVLESLPNEAPVDLVKEAEPIRREAVKVGRNDPCPCGSGRKFKKCCEGKPVPVGAPPHGPPVPRRMSDRELARLRPAALTELPLEKLSTLRLIQMARACAEFRRWKEGERVLEVLAQRSDLPGEVTPDDYREELLEEAVEAQAWDVARRQAALLAAPADLAEDLKINLALAEHACPSLQLIESMALQGLRDEGPDLVDLAYALLRGSPALGVLVARGVITPGRSLDVPWLLDAIEEARDGMELPPGDEAAELVALRDEGFADAPDDSRPEPDASEVQYRQETEALRQEARRAAQRVSELERTVRLRSAELEHLREVLAARSEAPQDTEEVRRLRAKVAEFKTLIQEGNESRLDLRRQIADLGKRVHAHRGRRRQGNHPTPAEDLDAMESAAPPQRLRVLTPVFERLARDALSAVPAEVAARALSLVASLAGADPDAWRDVKQLLGAPDVRSSRVGIHYRVLFRVHPEVRELTILDLVPRAELDTAVKRYH